MDDEERQRVIEVEQANQERSRLLFNKSEDESVLKHKRRANGKD
jgi:hypothetical protein